MPLKLRSAPAFTPPTNQIFNKVLKTHKIGLNPNHLHLKLL